MTKMGDKKNKNNSKRPTLVKASKRRGKTITKHLNELSNDPELENARKDYAEAITTQPEVFDNLPVTYKRAKWLLKKGTIVDPFTLHFLKNIKFYLEINNVGFAVRPLLGLTQVDLLEAKTIMMDGPAFKDVKWQTIRKEKDRKQRPIKGDNSQIPLIRKIFKAVEKQFPPGTIIHEQALLFGEPGTKPQPEIHADYLIKKEFWTVLNSGNYWIVPISVLIALDTACFLIVYPKSHRFWIMSDAELTATPPIGAIVVRVEPGEALYFRSDLLHQGGAYPELEYPLGNCRLHCFAVSEGPGNQLGITHTLNKFNAVIDKQMLRKLVRME